MIGELDLMGGGSGPVLAQSHPVSAALVTGGGGGGAACCCMAMKGKPDHD